MLSPLAKNTIQQIERALDDDQTTAISEIIKIIQELAGRTFSISVAELSELIGRDSTITEKVISAANTLGFNPSGAPINTITEAIHTVGFEKIRNLAISIMLAENAGKHQNTYEQREMAAMSVCSGLLSATLIKEKNKAIDPELAYVCTSLRNYGKLLMSTFLVQPYREARALSTEMGIDPAFRHVFGITPLALGRKILERSNLPRSILAALRDVTRETLAQPAETTEDTILMASEFSSRICEITFDEHIGPEDFKRALKETTEKFAQSFEIDLESVNEAMEKMESEMRRLNRAIGIKESASPATRKLRARATGRSLPQSPKPQPLPTSVSHKSFTELSEAEKEAFAEESFGKVEALMEASLQEGKRVNVHAVYDAVCEFLVHGLNLKTSMIFVKEEYAPDRLSARHGFGALFEKAKNRPLIAPSNKDIFSICLAKGEDILIQDTEAGRIKSVIPHWIHTCGTISSMILLPVKVESRIHALILGAASDQRSIMLSDGDLRRIRQIRSQLSKLQAMIAQRKVVPE